MAEELWEEGRGLDFLESLGPDISATVFSLLDDPADLARATAVSHSWRRFVIANQFSKILCLRVYPEVSNFTRIELSSFSSAHRNAGSSACAGLEKLGRDHRVYMHLSHGLLSPYDPKDCISHCMGASSTDHFPEEAIENTLEPVDRKDRRPSYWSSGGEKDPAVPECLIYRLQSELCLVDEIRIRPLKAFFRHGHPIYSAKHVRFRLGYLKLPLWSETHVYCYDPCRWRHAQGFRSYFGYKRGTNLKRIQEEEEQRKSRGGGESSFSYSQFIIDALLRQYTGTYRFSTWAKPNSRPSTTTTTTSP